MARDVLPFDPETMAVEPSPETLTRARMEAMGRRGLGASMGDSARELASSLMGAPGTFYGETTRSTLAGARSLLPGYGNYQQERQAIDTDEGLSGIPEVRTNQIREANRQDMIGMGAGMAAPIMFHGSRSGVIRGKFKPDRAGLSYFADDPKVSQFYGPHMGRYDVRPKATLDLGSNPYDLSGLQSSLRNAGRPDLADRVAERFENGQQNGPAYGVFSALRDPEIVSALRKHHDSFTFRDDHDEYWKPEVMAVFPEDVPITFKSDVSARLQAMRKKGAGP